LVAIIIPALVEVLGKDCFSLCKSLSSVTFESGSRLSKRFENALIQSGFHGATHQGLVEKISAVKD
jgi:hypothetical protein